MSTQGRTRIRGTSRFTALSQRSLTRRDGRAVTTARILSLTVHKTRAIAVSFARFCQSFVNTWSDVGRRCGSIQRIPQKPAEFTVLGDAE
jgi:hypothetical protein